MAAGFVVARYNSNGSLDTSFDSDGIAAIDLPSAFAHDVAIQADGKIVAVGGTGNVWFGLARFNSDGSLDTTFGTGGKLTTAIGSAVATNAVVVQSDGMIVVAGGSNGDFALARYAGGLVVDSTVDAGDNNPGDGVCATSGGQCTLRAAIEEANAFAGDDIITLPGGIYTLSLGSELTISSNLIILSSAGATSTIIQAAATTTSATHRVLRITSGNNVTISDVTIRHGNASGGASVDKRGGGISNEGTLTLIHTTVSENTASEDGGGIFSLAAPVTLANSTVSGNTAGRHAGGIFNEGGSGTVGLTNSTVSGNISTNLGGGITNRGTLTLTNSTVSGSTTSGNGGGIYNFTGGSVILIDSIVSGNTAVPGGGVYTLGAVTLTNSTVSGNTANVNGSGGGIVIDGAGTLTLTNSTVSGNTAAGSGGGGISNGPGGTVTLTESTVSDNTAVGAGGNGSGAGIRNFGTLTLTNSTVSDNTAIRTGGGIANQFGTTTLINSTVSGNTTGPFGGGGIGNLAGTLTLTNSTVSNNTSGNGGGGIRTEAGGATQLVNTIIAKNTDSTAPDCFGSPTSLGHNLIGDDTGCGFTSATGDLVGSGASPVDAKLGSLANNGGPTNTHALLSGSPALDVGNPATPGSGGNACEPTDQRGTARPQNGRCDIGAYELVTGPNEWTQLAPAGTAWTARGAHPAVYDPGSNAMVVFAGRDASNNLFNDVARLLDANGDTDPRWDVVNVSGALPTAPNGGRWLHQAVYDSDTDRMIVHGGGLGFSSPFSNETWVLTDVSGGVGTSTWSLISSGGPAPRFDHSAVDDDANDRMIVFAGSNCVSAPSFGADVWVLSDADGIGTPTWTQLSPTGSITDRFRHTAAYDPTSNRMIVYGGANNSGTPVVFNDVHVLTEANGLGGTPQWIDITPTSGPAPPPDGPRSFYDVDDNRLIIFGGPLGNAVWVLQNANGLGGPTNWVEITPTSGQFPDSSGNHSMVFDAANDRIIIFGGNLDGSPLNEVWTLDIASADLAVTKSVDDPSPDEGDTVTFTVTLTNNGPDAATGVVVTDVVPSGLTLQSATSSVGAYSAGTWTLASSLASSTSATLTLVTVVDAGTTGSTITNTATVTASDQSDPVSGNNSASAAVTVTATGADLAVTKSVDDSSPGEGDTVAFTVTLTNNGPDAATGVVVSDVIPSGLTFQSATSSVGAYSAGTWTLASSLASSTSATLTLVTVVDAGTTGSTITKTATVTASDQADPVSGNDSDSAAVTVAAPTADLAVTKSVDTPLSVEGRTVTFTITVTNNGPDAATGVVVSDVIPSGLTLQSATSSVGTYSAGTWTLGSSLASTNSAPLTLVTVVDAGTLGSTITNTATVTASDQADPASGNDSDSAAIKMTTAAAIPSLTVWGLVVMALLLAAAYVWRSRRRSRRQSA